ncbi:unnamed protein product [Rotaria magnacalcarata]|uniref:Uncharacterized protein n=2 Tax=Rotaria magnacalcarata TaxID=392030 RepID=A0A8S3EXW8_9BILA|nr:unnamed protein product [Rotaria magnacalcarata]
MVFKNKDLAGRPDTKNCVLMCILNSCSLIKIDVPVFDKSISCSIMSWRNKFTFGLTVDAHKPKVKILDLCSRTGGGSSTIELKHGQTADLVDLISGAPSA